MFMDKAYGEDLIKFYRECVRTRSYSDEEGDIARLVAAKMKELGFDEAYIDPSGNAVGRVGAGPRTVNVDSHMDIVRVNDGELWDAPPFVRFSLRAGRSRPPRHNAPRCPVLPRCG